MTDATMFAGLKGRKLLIIDQSLRGHDGHHFEYDHAIACAARDLGIDVTVAGGRSSTAEIASSFERFLPHFSTGWHEAHLSSIDGLARRVLAGLPGVTQGPLIRLASKWRHLRSPARTQKNSTLPGFGREVVNLIQETEFRAGADILIHTLSVPELQSLIEATSNLIEAPDFHVVLRRDAEERQVADGPWGGIRGAFQMLRQSPHARRFRFYSDTRQLCEQYEALLVDYTVREIAIPHSLDGEPIVFPRNARDPVRFAYLGNARTEKGFHYIADAVDRLAQTHVNKGRARFVLQANSNMSLEENLIRDARRKLQRHPSPSVELLLKPLTTAEFQQQLLLADVVLLPYLAAAYRRRSSGILVQAMVSGKPVIVPSGTWLSDAATPGAAVVFDDPRLLHLAIEDAVRKIAQLQEAAQRGAKNWRLRHNARALLQALYSSCVEMRADVTPPLPPARERHV